jgi:DNA-binding response OmpR family regulator
MIDSKFSLFYAPSLLQERLSADMARVLLVEGRSTNNKDASLAIPLRRRYTVTVATSAKRALALAEQTPPDIIVLDASSMRTTGNRTCTLLRRQLPAQPIIHIVNPTPGAGKFLSDADVMLYPPFTPRKLFNRIDRFLAAREGELIEVGPLRLNLKSKILITHKGEFRLTPKMATLLEAFMRHPNEVLERRYLMGKVWQTDYLGDTRTLDVHIRWIREAVEENPSKPLYIKTVRGVGYLFNLRGRR